MQNPHSYWPGMRLIFSLVFFFLHVFLCFRVFCYRSSFQCIVACSGNKSWFLREQKEEWDCLTKEARLRGDVGVQLAAAQQREAEACRDIEEIHGMFEDLSARVKLDEEATSRLRKEQDELLQKDVVASEQAIELLAELEMERDLKLKAKERSMVL